MIGSWTFLREFFCCCCLNCCNAYVMYLKTSTTCHRKWLLLALNFLLHVREKKHWGAKVKNMQEKYFLEQVCRGGVWKLLRSPGKFSRNRFRQPMCLYENPIPTRFLAPTDCSKIPAQKKFCFKPYFNILLKRTAISDNYLTE